MVSYQLERTLIEVNF